MTQNEIGCLCLGAIGGFLLGVLYCFVCDVLSALWKRL